MRYGFIGDVHGAYDALQWALNCVGVADRVVCLGDVVDGPRDADCVALLQAREVLVLQGNHDFWAAARAHQKGVPPDTRDWLEALPRRFEDGDLLVYHSMYGESYDDAWWDEIVSDRDVARALGASRHRIIVCAHTHVPMVFRVVGDDVTCILSDALRACPRVTLDADARYVVNVGLPTVCVALLDRANSTVEFVFRTKESVDGR